MQSKLHTMLLSKIERTEIESKSQLFASAVAIAALLLSKIERTEIESKSQHGVTIEQLKNSCYQR